MEIGRGIMANWRKYFVVDRENCDIPTYLVFKKHIIDRDEEDYEYELVGAFDNLEAAEWHAEELADIMEAQAEKALLGSKD